MEPRFTVSVQMVARSTDGAAGLSRATPTVSATRIMTPAAPQIIWRRRFCSLNSGRAMSIPLGIEQTLRHLEFSVVVESKAHRTAGRLPAQEVVSCPVENCPISDSDLIRYLVTLNS